MYKKDQVTLINYLLKQWDKINSSERTRRLILPERQKIVKARKAYYLKNGWRKATRNDLQKFTDNTTIRCFVSSCGCIGQLTKVYTYTNELRHRGHGAKIAYKRHLYSRYVWETGVAQGIFIKKVDFPK